MLIAASFFWDCHLLTGNDRTFFFFSPTSTKFLSTACWSLCKTFHEHLLMWYPQPTIRGRYPHLMDEETEAAGGMCCFVTVLVNDGLWTWTQS
jgi:hypothetical protein